jgi:uncharacterized protein
MKIQLDSASSGYRVSAYGLGYFLVNEERLEHSIVLSSEYLDRDWAPQTFEALRAEHLEPLLGHAPELVIVGTGTTQHFLSNELTLPFLSQSIGLEVMDTAAACRTYNILAAEDRRVTAALIVLRG